MVEVSTALRSTGRAEGGRMRRRKRANEMDVEGLILAFICIATVMWFLDMKCGICIDPHSPNFMRFKE